MTSKLTRQRIELIANFHRAMTLPPSHDEIEELARMALAAMDCEPVYQYQSGVYNDDNGETDWYWDDCDKGFYEQYAHDRRRILYRHAQPAPVVPDEMLCDFYEVNNWTDLVRELVKHVEQLQDSARRNVKPWEDTFPETLLPAYIERIKHADEACRAAMLNGGKP
ncbi:TPA: hypothetical protein R2K58_004503 [Raoultella ornithinolytica]|nr:hypothetical protein [Raoultella ornithinolytica]HEC2621066.1 hypothetical protein [Raoultella ornithinolytica]